MKHVLPSRQYLDILLQHHPSLVCVLDGNGIIKYVGGSLQKFVGYQAHELLGKPALTFVAPEDQRIVKRNLLAVEAAGTTELPDFRYRTQNSEWRWIQGQVVNHTGNEQIRGYVLYLHDIHERKKKETEAQTNLHYYNSLFYNHPGIVFSLTPAGTFNRINANIKQILLYEEAEMIGEHFSKFTAPSFTFEAIKALSKASNREPSILEGKVINKQGKVVTLLITLIPVNLSDSTTGVLGIARDISAEKAAQKELEKLSLVASKAVNCVIITDATGRVEWVNSEFTRVTGYTLSEMLGKKPGHVLQGQETDPAAVQLIDEQLKKRIPFHIELLNYRKNGEKFWFSMNITPMLDDEGNLERFFAIQDDVTDRKMAEKKLQLLTEDLDRHNKELQQFNYIVSHNLRTPVANLLGLTSILERQYSSDDSSAKVLQKVRQTALDLYNVLKDLNDLLSLRDISTGLSQELVSIAAVCREVLNSMEDKFESLQAKVTMAIPGDVSMHATKAYIYSIFYNLLSNAIKYRAPGRALEVNIGYEVTGDRHLITFSDNGVGIDLQKARNSLFKLYGKIDKKADGRGIGLYMVKAQVEAIGGTIDVKSTPGVGTTFTLSFREENIHTGTPKA